MPASPQSAEKDPRVQSAISHWAPRLVANGVPLSDFEQLTSSCARWEDWCSAGQAGPPDCVRLVDEASGPTELLIVEDDNHIVNNRPYRWRSRSADWLAKQLGLPQQ